MISRFPRTALVLQRRYIDPQLSKAVLKKQNYGNSYRCFSDFPNGSLHATHEENSHNYQYNYKAYKKLFGTIILFTYLGWTLTLMLWKELLCLSEEELTQCRQEAMEFITNNKEHYYLVDRDKLLHSLEKKYCSKALHRVAQLPPDDYHAFVKDCKIARNEWLKTSLYGDQDSRDMYNYWVLYHLIYTPEQYEKIRRSNRKDTLTAGILLTAREIEELHTHTIV